MHEYQTCPLCNLEVLSVNTVLDDDHKELGEICLDCYSQEEPV